MAAVMAMQKEMDVWWGVDPDDPQFPLLYIRLPQGDVSWHINLRDLILPVEAMQEEMFGWDGHTVEQKYERVKKFILDGFYGVED